MTISILRSNCLAIDSTDSSVRVWVRVAISPSFIRALITSAAESPRLSATSRTVAPELTLIAGCSSGCFSSLSLALFEQRAAPASAAAARRSRRRGRLGDVIAAGGLRVDHHAAAALGPAFLATSAARPAAAGLDSAAFAVAAGVGAVFFGRGPPWSWWRSRRSLRSIP